MFDVRRYVLVVRERRFEFSHFWMRLRIKPSDLLYIAPKLITIGLN